MVLAGICFLHITARFVSPRNWFHYVPPYPWSSVTHYCPRDTDHVLRVALQHLHRLASTQRAPPTGPPVSHAIGLSSQVIHDPWTQSWPPGIWFIYSRVCIVSSCYKQDIATSLFVPFSSTEGTKGLSSFNDLFLFCFLYQVFSSSLPSTEAHFPFLISHSTSSLKHACGTLGISYFALLNFLLQGMDHVTSAPMHNRIINCKLPRTDSWNAIHRTWAFYRINLTYSYSSGPAGRGWGGCCLFMWWAFISSDLRWDSFPGGLLKPVVILVSWHLMRQIQAKAWHLYLSNILLFKLDAAWCQVESEGSLSIVQKEVKSLESLLGK